MPRGGPRGLLFEAGPALLLAGGVRKQRTSVHPVGPEAETRTAKEGERKSGEARGPVRTSPWMAMIQN